MNAEMMDHSRKPFWSLKRAASMLIAAGIVFAGVAVAIVFVRTKPKARPMPKERTAPFVTVVSMVPTNVHVHIDVMGTVEAVDEVMLQPEVSGRILWTHPELVEGGTVTGDEVVVRIDESDVELALRRQKAALESARSDLSIEKGQQDIAKREWELVGGGDEASEMDLELALRGPQLRAREASVASAEAAVAAANLDLSRTAVRAPFNAVVAEAAADVGDQAMANTVLATLVGTDLFRLRTAVRVDQLKWIDFPGDTSHPASQVRIFLPTGVVRTGTVSRLMPQLSEAGRMAQILVDVSDPLYVDQPDRKDAALLLGQVLRVEIVGREIEGVYGIPRTALRDGSKLWMVDGDSRLRIFPVEVLWGTEDQVFVADGFDPDDRLIVSHLATPVEGMKLEAEETVPDSDEQAAEPRVKKNPEDPEWQLPRSAGGKR